MEVWKKVEPMLEQLNQGPLPTPPARPEAPEPPQSELGPNKILRPEPTGAKFLATMTNKKRFLVSMAVLAGLAVVLGIFVCSGFAPQSVREHRQAAFADARTVWAVIRYLATPELPPPPQELNQWQAFMTNLPQTIPPARRLVASTNDLELAISNQVSLASGIRA